MGNKRAGIIIRKYGTNLILLEQGWGKSLPGTIYDIPKGHWEPGELLEDTAIREAKEEAEAELLEQASNTFTHVEHTGVNWKKLLSELDSIQKQFSEWEEGELEEAMKHYPMNVYQTLNPHITFVIRPNEQELKVCSSDYKIRVENKEEVVFVHTLQHALKHCKIEKEIVL